MKARVKTREVEVRVEKVPYVRQLSRRELQEVAAGVEDAMLRGTAQIGDYENFILCKQELVRRADLGIARAEGNVEAEACEKRPWAARDLWKRFCGASRGGRRKRVQRSLFVK